MNRQRRNRLPAALMFAVSVLGACSGAGTDSTPSANGPASPQRTPAPANSTGGVTSTGEPTSSLPPPPRPEPTDVAATLQPSPTGELAAWQTAELHDVRTGETLRVADLAGRLVVIEPMAIWCSNCRAQQDAVIHALAALGELSVVYISLDVDPNEIEPDLAAYADTRGYGWHFAVASRDVARSLAAVFGDQVLSPPSTPKIIVAPSGQVSVSFGFKSAADLQAEVTANLP